MLFLPRTILKTTFEEISPWPFKIPKIVVDVNIVEFCKVGSQDFVH